jgi:hypothetical protein
MLSHRNTQLPIRWILAGTALLLAAIVYYLRPVLAAGGAPDTLLPLPPPRTQLDLVRSLQTLIMASHTEKSVALARVIAVERGDVRQLVPNPEKADRQQREAAVRFLPTSHIETLGGRFQVLETLYGPPPPRWLQVDHREYFRRMAKLNGAWGSGPGEPATTVMQKGEYWLLVYNPQTRAVETGYSEATWLNGPDDPLLRFYRRYLDWRARARDPRLLEEVRTVLLNPTEPEPLRHAALSMMADLVDWDCYGFYRKPDYPYFLRVLRQLFAQTNLPRELQHRAMDLIRIDVRREVAAGSDEAFLLRYLLGIVGREQDGTTLDRAADVLYFITGETETIEGRMTHFYFPDIIAALEKREAFDRSHRPDGLSYVSRTLGNLELAGRRWMPKVEPGPNAAPAVVVRRLPTS